MFGSTGSPGSALTICVVSGGVMPITTFCAERGNDPAVIGCVDVFGAVKVESTQPETASARADAPVRVFRVSALALGFAARRAPRVRRCCRHIGHLTCVEASAVRHRLGAKEKL